MSTFSSKKCSDDGVSRYFDSEKKRWVVTVLPGTQYVSRDEDEVIATVLGSCVAACIWDPLSKVGGVNHFMLPHDDAGLWSGASLALRYGNHAMDALINELLQQGAEKKRLNCKFFGGGNVVKGLGRVGSKNALFAKEYSAVEQLNVTKMDLGGESGRRILFEPVTGRAWRKFLDASAGLSVVHQEALLQPKIEVAPTSIELF
ncbi:CheD, stimulates methylation of MCP protein [Hirschia baltica]|uniref:Probable chemoreceptor glutamine deamidase CheD n=1 Tax=Hirschia baltica (strain ATCC 49814 / DSM 5838 / IFAM 1418) TaxID=582402 RepID=C6XM16_HIRBI|nr:CheD, stimulates methylation of MCP protein [Hirschia baltica]ACT59848.1 CheD, stimulates methylation of MCP protein [Hirschia baltica ATCC 49814]